MTDSKSPQLGIPNKDVTYWLNHETSEYVMHDPNTDLLLSIELEDNHATQVDEYKYVHDLIKKIDSDPNHTLPEGVAGIIKSAVIENNKFSGAIWYTKKNIPNGTMVSSTQIVERKPGGLIVTERSTYLVEVI